MKKLFLGAIVLATLGSTFYLYNSFSSPNSNKENNQTQTSATTNEKVAPSNTNTNSQLETTPQNKKEITILNAIHQIAITQTTYSYEKGTYASSIAQLSVINKGSDILKKMSAAIKKNGEYEGYLITELFADDDTEDTRTHYGVLAKAINSDKNKSCLLLMDLNKQQAFSEKNQDIYKAKEIQILEADNPPNLTKWPTPAELKNWSPSKAPSADNQNNNAQP